MDKVSAQLWCNGSQVWCVKKYPQCDPCYTLYVYRMGNHDDIKGSQQQEWLPPPMQDPGSRGMMTHLDGTTCVLLGGRIIFFFGLNFLFVKAPYEKNIPLFSPFVCLMNACLIDQT